jgi:hypothetical protein
MISLDHAHANTPSSVNQVVMASIVRRCLHAQDDHAGSSQLRLREAPRLSQDEHVSFVAVCLFAPGQRPIVHLCHRHCLKLNTLHNRADLLS